MDFSHDAMLCQKNVRHTYLTLYFYFQCTSLIFTWLSQLSTCHVVPMSRACVCPYLGKIGFNSYLIEIIAYL